MPYWSVAWVHQHEFQTRTHTQHIHTQVSHALYDDRHELLLDAVHPLPIDGILHPFLDVSPIPRGLGRPVPFGPVASFSM